MTSQWPRLRLVRTRPVVGVDHEAVQQGPAAPTGEERDVMAAHGIRFDGRGFRFAGFRHDRLADAIDASQQAGRGRD